MFMVATLKSCFPRLVTVWLGAHFYRGELTAVGCREKRFRNVHIWNGVQKIRGTCTTQYKWEKL